MITLVEQKLGWFRPDDNGKWWSSKNKDKFTRYFDTDFREVIHKVSGYDEWDQQKEGWTVSLGYKEKQFSQGYKVFDTTAEAREWADNRTEDEWEFLDHESTTLMNRWKATQPKPEPEIDAGF